MLLWSLADVNIFIVVVAVSIVIIVVIVVVPGCCRPHCRREQPLLNPQRSLLITRPCWIRGRGSSPLTQKAVDGSRG